MAMTNTGGRGGSCVYMYELYTVLARAYEEKRACNYNLSNYKWEGRVH